MAEILQRRCYAAMRSPPKARLLITPNLQATKIPVVPPAISDDLSLKSTWSQRAWLATGTSAVLVSIGKALITAGSWKLEPILAGYAGYVLADLGSGVYHWGIDNYGDETTPLFGGQIAAFQGHHKWPWTITKREFANNLHALARVIAMTVIPINVVCGDPAWLAFVAVFSGCIMYSQQFHAWAHSTKSKLPPVVVALQDMGVLVSRSQHAAHHRPPYNTNYCIVSGLWNEFLDKNQVFEALEIVIYLKTGVRPRSWAEPSSDWAMDSPAQ